MRGPHREDITLGPAGIGLSRPFGSFAMCRRRHKDMRKDQMASRRNLEEFGKLHFS